MATSIFLAKILGLYLIIVCLFTVIRYQYLEKTLGTMRNQPATFLMMALITLISGILLVVSHNVWVADWRVIITILAWLIFIGGIARLLFAEKILELNEHWIKNKGAFLSTTIIFLLIGCYLLYKGFF